jgi:hypothetical protein
MVLVSCEEFDESWRVSESEGKASGSRGRCTHATGVVKIRCVMIVID